MTNLKTDPELLARMKRAARHEMTAEEIRQQKISWVYGQLMDCCPEVTREQVERRLNDG